MLLRVLYYLTLSVQYLQISMTSLVKHEVINLNSLECYNFIINEKQWFLQYHVHTPSTKIYIDGYLG